MRQYRWVGNRAARLLAVALASVLVTSASANLLLNAGFEDGDTGNIGDGVPNWNVWGNSGWHHDDAGKTLDSKAIKFWWDDAGVWQDVTVAAGQEYEFSVMALSASDDLLIGWNGLLKAEFYNSAVGTGSGDVLAAVDVDRFYSASDPQGQWVQLSGTVTAPANADLGRIILMIGDWQPDPGGSLNFDNAAINPVPEPAALVLLVLAGVVVRRR